ncbi:MAG: hypothetical protein ACRERE_29685 [Candidatus Entotheonellia bacterium]
MHRVEGFRLVRPLVLFARFIASAVALIGAVTSALAAEQKPNIVFIRADNR